MNVTVISNPTIVNGVVTIDGIVVNGTVAVGTVGGGGQAVEYYYIGYIDGIYYNFINFTLPDLSLYTLESVNQSLKVYSNGAKLWWSGGSINFPDEYGQWGNLLEFWNAETRIEIEFTNKLVLI